MYNICHWYLNNCFKIYRMIKLKIYTTLYLAYTSMHRCQWNRVHKLLISTFKMQYIFFSIKVLINSSVGKGLKHIFNFDESNRLHRGVSFPLSVEYGYIAIYREKMKLRTWLILNYRRSIWESLGKWWLNIKHLEYNLRAKYTALTAFYWNRLKKNVLRYEKCLTYLWCNTT